MSRTQNNQRAVRARKRTQQILDCIDLTPTQIAVQTGIPRPTVYAHLQRLRTELREATQQDALAWRKVQLEELAQLREALSDAKVSPGRRIELAISLLDREIKLTGSAAESKAVIAHVSGPKLDALYLDVRAILMDLPREDQEEGLEHLRAWAKNRKQPVTVSALMLEGPDANLS